MLSVHYINWLLRSATCQLWNFFLLGTLFAGEKAKITGCYTCTIGNKLIQRVSGYKCFVIVSWLHTARIHPTSLAESTQFLVFVPISLRSILMLSSHLRLYLPKGIFPAGLPIKILYFEYNFILSIVIDNSLCQCCDWVVTDSNVALVLRGSVLLSLLLQC